MKTCSKCKVEKHMDAFSPRKETRSKSKKMSWCRSCYGHYNKQYRKKTKNDGISILGWLISRFKNVPCMDCNNVYPFECMDFDHRPDEIKSFGIARKGSQKATSERIAEVMKEIAKCDLICSNCHRTRTVNRPSKKKRSKYAAFS